jgi:transcriptional regulator with XRE-family HTH domain
MIKETFGEYIHRLRLDSRMTLTKLAAALDIDQSTLSKIENGKRNIPETILPKLAKSFNLNLKELEKEFYSEKIAEIIYKEPNSNELLRLAEQKVDYLKQKNSVQGNLNL